MVLLLLEIRDPAGLKLTMEDEADDAAASSWPCCWWWLW
jgi:hypothetical protein